jgi:hypothetical protein
MSTEETDYSGYKVAVLSGCSKPDTLCESEIHILSLHFVSLHFQCITDTLVQCFFFLFLTALSSSSFVYYGPMGGTGEQFPLCSPWYWFLLWQLQFIRTGLSWILCNWYPRPFYHVQKFLCSHSLFCTHRVHWTVHSLQHYNSFL